MGQSWLVKVPGSLFLSWFIYGGFLKWWDFPPKSSILIGVFQYFHHPFWGTPIFGNTLIWNNPQNKRGRLWPSPYIPWDNQVSFYCSHGIFWCVFYLEHTKSWRTNMYKQIQAFQFGSYKKQRGWSGGQFMKCHKKSGVEWWNLMLNGTCCEFFPQFPRKTTPHAIPLANYERNPVTACWETTLGNFGENGNSTLHTHLRSFELGRTVGFYLNQPPTTANPGSNVEGFHYQFEGLFGAVKKRRWTQLGNHHFQLISSFFQCDMWMFRVAKVCFVCVSGFLGQSKRPSFLRNSPIPWSFAEKWCSNFETFFEIALPWKLNQ